MPTTQNRAHALRQRAATAVLVLMTLALVGAACAVFSGAYQVRPVLSSSMTPQLPVGGAVITQRVPVSSVRAGDVIVFHDPYAPTKLVVHRITTLTRTDGTATIQTKGDANRVTDPWTVTLRGDTSYRAVGVIPHVGRVAVWVHQPAIASHVVPIGLAMAGLALAIMVWPRRGAAAGLRGATSADDDSASALDLAPGTGPTVGVGSLFVTDQPALDAVR